MFLVSATVASLRITDCRGFSKKRNSVIFAGHLGTMSFTTRCCYGIPYRDCLSEEIEILRLMLYKDEFLGKDPKACKHSGTILANIDENVKELSDLDNHSAA